MKITADKLAAQLGKSLAPLYFVAGDEPLLVDEVVDAIRAAARRQGYTERDAYMADGRFDWADLRSGLNNLSLFASRKIVEVRLPTGKPGRQGGEVIVALLADPPPDTLFILIAPQLDKAGSSTKWAQSLQRAAVWVDIRPLPPERLPAWIGQRMQAAGLRYDNEALDIMAARVEGNLLAAQQEISKLALLVEGGRVTADDVRNSVADGARYDIFQLADAALGQDLARAVRILHGLRREGIAAPLTLWVLAREINALVNVWTRLERGMPLPRAMADAGIWRTRQPLIARALRGHNNASVRRLLASAGLADRIVKGARPGLPWIALQELVLMLARPEQTLRAGMTA